MNKKKESSMNDNLIEFKNLHTIMPNIFTKNGAKYILRNREKNGFYKCLIKFSERKLFVDINKLAIWIDEKRYI